MITKEQLESIGYLTKEGTIYKIPETWNYEYNIGTQYLWNLNEGIGQPEFIEKVTDVERLKEILEIK